MATVLGVALAGAAGALARWGLEALIGRRVGEGFPWGIFVVNVSGSFVAGIAFVLLTQRPGAPDWWRTTVLVGLLGAFTTFSTLSVQTVRLVESGAYAPAAANALGSLAAGLVAAGAGIALARSMTGA